MKIKKLAATVGAAALVMFGVTTGTAGPVSAANNIKSFGTQMTLKYPGMEIGYTVEGISPSTAVVPYPVIGRLYESMVTVRAVWGSVTPMIPFFSARAESGLGAPAIANVATPDGLSPATLPPGATSSGKIYFDILADDPNSVVYGNGFEDLLAWVP